MGTNNAKAYAIAARERAFGGSSRGLQSMSTLNNWYALLVSILTTKDCSSACKAMGIDVPKQKHVAPGTYKDIAGISYMLHVVCGMSFRKISSFLYARPDTVRAAIKYYRTQQGGK